MRYQSAEHELDHRHLDESGSGACKTFIVAGEAAASAEPSECALDDPATRQNLEHRECTLDEAAVEPGVVRDHHGGGTREVFHFYLRDRLTGDHLRRYPRELGDLDGDRHRWFTKP